MTDTPAEREHASIGLVAIGASAGGIAALKDFFDGVPEETGIAFVVIMHLSPEHESNLADVLQPHVRFPVSQVTGRTALEPDHVYVIPPNRSLSLDDGSVELAEFEEPRGRRAPIDMFFRTVADVHPDGVGVLLSGSGTDGVVGMKAIKEAGGLIMAQSPEDAEYETMPAAAIATGLVDFVLPARELGARAVELRATGWRPHPEAEKLPDGEARDVRKILAHLQTQTGHDFSGYKESTMARRVGRRMRVTRSEDLRSYLGYLRGDAAEVDALRKDLLISVTNFFRDPEAFEALESLVIPKIFESRGADDEVRVWVPGCATGEEAYSIAILLAEEAARHEPGPPFRVFASDLDEDALAFARDGIYAEAIAADVSEERLDRFFVRDGSYYRVRSDLRERVLFAPHSLLRDPPFSRLDLVSCRNVLIYLQRELQEKVLHVLHYSLREGGALLLGGSETTEIGKSRFRPLDKERRIYVRQSARGEAAAHLPDLPLSMAGRTRSGRFLSRTPTARQQRSDGEVHKRALDAAAPPSLVVDEEHSIIHVSAAARRYLQFPSGSPTSNLLLVAREELRADLRSALFRALDEGESVRSPWLPVVIEGESRRVQVHVSPVESEGDGATALVVFLETAPEQAEHEDEEHAAASGRQLEQVERELARTKDQLWRTIDESETHHEELKASNEELQSINEEYKSTLEELETSKEELQSMNEELHTVNVELENKVEELATANDDLRNLMAATEVPTLFLDRELRIHRFTPRLGQLFNVRDVDVGRPLSHVTHALDYDGLEADCRSVLDDLQPIERETRKGDEHYLVRVAPYRTLDDRIAGVVVTFADVTRIRRSAEELRRSEERVRLLIEGVREYAIFMIDTDGRITLWNSGAEEIFGYSEEEAVGRRLPIIFTEEDRAADAPRREMEEARESGTARDERWHVRRDGSRFWASGVLTAVHDAEGGLRGFAKLLRDNTERREREDELRRSRTELERLAGTLEERVVERTEELGFANERIRQLASEVIIAEQRVRRRVARQLHDDLQQRLYAIQMSMPMVREALHGGDPERAAGEVDKLETRLGQAVDLTRHLTVDLSPRTLEGEGLREALGWLRDQMRELHGLEVEVRSDEGFDVRDEDLGVVVFQSIRELLFNIVKHADVGSATVTLTHQDGHRAIRIEDGGVGFDVQAASERGEQGDGFGLFNVRERLHLVGGDLELESAPGDGTRATILLPDPEPGGGNDAPVADG